MILQHLATARLEIWAVCDDDGTCQVVEELQRAAFEHPALAAEMGALLLGYVPEKGVPHDDPRLFGKLGKDVFELKACEYAEPKKKKGKVIGLRVAFFFDSPLRLICTNAFAKTKHTPQAAKEAAHQAFTRYFADKQAGALIYRGWESGDDEVQGD